MSVLYDIAICPHCQSTNLIRQTGNNEPTTHYGRLSCGDCGRWLTWLRDPSTSLQWQVRATTIDQILINHVVTDWEREFLKSLREQRVLSFKQQDRLNAIGLKYLGIQFCATDGIPPPPLPPQSTKNPVPNGRGVDV